MLLVALAMIPLLLYSIIACIALKIAILLWAGAGSLETVMNTEWLWAHPSWVGWQSRISATQATLSRRWLLDTVAMPKRRFPSMHRRTISLYLGSNMFSAILWPAQGHNNELMHAPDRLPCMQYQQPQACYSLRQMHLAAGSDEMRYYTVNYMYAKYDG